jgi:hypothetical protein
LFGPGGQTALRSRMEQASGPWNPATRAASRASWYDPEIKITHERILLAGQHPVAYRGNDRGRGLCRLFRTGLLP